jgi:hypothetical protein
VLDRADLCALARLHITRTAKNGKRPLGLNPPFYLSLPPCIPLGMECTWSSVYWRSPMASRSSAASCVSLGPSQPRMASHLACRPCAQPKAQSCFRKSVVFRLPQIQSQNPSSPANDHMGRSTTCHESDTRSFLIAEQVHDNVVGPPRCNNTSLRHQVLIRGRSRALCCFGRGLAGSATTILRHLRRNDRPSMWRW